MRHDSKSTCPPGPDDAAADAYSRRLALVEEPAPRRSSGLLRALALAWAYRNGIAWPSMPWEGKE